MRTIKIFGKNVPIAILALLISGAMVSAGALIYFSIRGRADVTERTPVIAEPSAYKVQLAQGEEVSVSITVINRSDQPQPIELETVITPIAPENEDLTTDDMAIEELTVVYSRDWIPLPDSDEDGLQEMVLEPNEEVPIEVTIEASWLIVGGSYAVKTNIQEAEIGPPKIQTSMSIAPPSFELDSGGTLELTATLTDEDGNPLTDKEISWSATLGSVDPAVGYSTTYTAPEVDTNTDVTITASFAGDAEYAGSSATSEGTIIAAIPIPGIAVATLGELDGIRNDLTADYYLVSDIDATETITWNEGMGWEPIGDATTPFAGTLDGKGYTITGLYINRPTESEVGLFGQTDGAEIKNVGLGDVSVTGGTQTGALAGLMYNSSVVNSHATGSVSGVVAGGLIGKMGDTPVVGSHASVDVSATDIAGGLVGWMIDASIEDSYTTTSTVSSTGVIAGGLVGKIEYFDGPVPFVRGSHADSTTVTAPGQAGGLVGWMFTGSIEDSYATGTVDAPWIAGGLVGQTSWSEGMVIKGCYANCTVTNASVGPVGGLVGWLECPVEDSYAMGSASSTANGPAGGIAGKLTAPFGEVTASITNCYSITEVYSAEAGYCGLVGWMETEGTITDSMCKEGLGLDLIGFDPDYGPFPTTEGRVTYAPDSDMMSIELYTEISWLPYDDMIAPWDTTTVWDIVSGAYPRLLWE